MQELKYFWVSMHAMKACRKVEAQLHPFLTSGSQFHKQAALPLWEHGPASKICDPYNESIDGYLVDQQLRRLYCPAPHKC
jgi:hypothetical protein